MRILVIDHEEKDQRNLIEMFKRFEPDADVDGVFSLEEGLKKTEGKIVDLAFINPESGDNMTAEEFTLKLKERSKDSHVIFTAKSKKYMQDGFKVHADAYLVKPITFDDVQREADYLMNHYPAPLRPLEIIVRTFGAFNVYYRGRRLVFKRNKAKELLAILIDNRGFGLTTREACYLLFNGRKYDEITLGYFHVVLTSLKFTLEDYGIKGLIRKSVNYIAINPDLIDCDMYRYLKGDPNALKDYHGDYMKNYSWSEYNGVMTDRNSKDEE